MSYNVPTKSGVPMDVPPAGQKSPKNQGFPWTCLRRDKNPKQIRGSHGHMPPAGQKYILKKHVPVFTMV